jgi:hypothetical protein
MMLPVGLGDKKYSYGGAFDGKEKSQNISNAEALR